jgi:hypothetical protein
MNHLASSFTPPSNFPQSPNPHRSPTTAQFRLNKKIRIWGKAENESDHVVL